MNKRSSENSAQIQNTERAPSNIALFFVGDWRHALSVTNSAPSPIKPVAVQLAGHFSPPYLLGQFLIMGGAA